MKNQSKSYSLSILLLFIYFGINAQKITISGVVSDGTGPLPGVSILIKGTTTGTETNFDGEYSINANIGDTIVYSFVGMRAIERKISSFEKSNITLKEDIVMDIEMNSGTICYLRSKFIRVNYFGGFKNSKSGVQIDFHYLRLLDIEIDANIGYQTDFEQNRKLFIEGNFNSIFYLGKPINLSLKLNKLNIKSENFNYQEYKIIFNTYVKTIFKKYTKIQTGFGISNNSSNKNFGYEIGIQQYLSNSIGIYSNTTYWGNLWQLKNGFVWGYKRFNLFLEHHKIGTYNDFNIGFGYKVYL